MTWRTKKLGEVCDFNRGLTYSKKDEVGFSANVVLRATNIDLSTHTLNLTELRYIRDSFAVPEDKKVQKGALLICTASGSKSHLGKVALIDDDYGYAFGGFMGQIIPKEGLESKYLFYILIADSYKDYIKRLSSGVNINNLKFDDLKNFEIPLPPLVEQRRIVKKLDKIFVGLAKAKKITEKNLVNSHELFEAYLKDIFENPNKNWEVCELNDYVKFIDYRGRTPKKIASGVRLITAKNIKMGFLQKYPEEFISSKDYSSWMTRGIPKKGDILFTTEAPLANVAQLDTDEKVAFAQRTIILQSDPKKINSSFLKYLLMSQPVQKRIIHKGTGATVQGIKASLLKKIEICFPKLLSEQQAIVKKLDTFSVETKKLEEMYKQKLADLEELKKSVLQKAFSGRL